MTNLLIFLVSALWIFPTAVAFIILVLHRTHVVIEYAKLFGLGKFFKYDEFMAWEQENPGVGYFVFLDQQHSNFFTRLIRCPWCLATWLTGLLSFSISWGLSYYVSVPWAILISSMWTFNAGLIAVLFYFFGIFVYRLVFPVEKS